MSTPPGGGQGWGQGHQGWNQGQGSQGQGSQAGPSFNPPAQGQPSWGQSSPGWGAPGQNAGGQQGWGQPGQNPTGQQGWGQPGQNPTGQHGWGQPGQQPPGGPQPPKKTNLPLIIGAGVLVLALIAGLTYALWPKTTETVAPTPAPPTATAPPTTAPPTDEPTPDPTDTPTIARTTRPSPTRTSAKPPATGTVGQPIAFEARDGAGELIVHQVRYTTEGIIPPDHGAFLDLDVEVKVTSGSYRASFTNFTARDKAGRTYRLGLGSRAKPMLSPGSLNAGQNVRGWVSLDAPREPLTVSMKDLIDPVAEFEVAP